MKIRFDYVSNSSSCSFMISDFSNFIEKFKSLDFQTGDRVLNLDIRFCVSKENLEKYPELKVFKPEFYGNDEGYGRGYLYQLIDISPEAGACLDQLEVHCEDYEKEDVFLLSLLYETLDALGVDVEDCSEMELIPIFNGSSEQSKMIRILASKRDENEDTQ